MRLKAGDEISYRVAFLEMSKAPNLSWPELTNSNLFLILSRDPSIRYFLDLYNAVGSDYEWTDMHDLPVTEIEGFLNSTDVKLYTLLKNGYSAGFFILDNRLKYSCDLSYFGLVPGVIGTGLGKLLLRMAVKLAWALPKIDKLTVNTCSPDHPNALSLYKKIGFEISKVEQSTRVLKYSRNIDYNNWLDKVRN